jgi:hypothetical protein
MASHDHGALRQQIPALARLSTTRRGLHELGIQGAYTAVLGHSVRFTGNGPSLTS